MTDGRRARASRREASRRATSQRDRSRRWIVAVVAVIAVAGVLAIVLGGSMTDGSSPAVSVGPDRSASADISGATGALPVITGSTLPAYVSTGDDPAVGMFAPTVTGSSFNGSPVAIQPTGRPTVLIFIAHWCPHCQREVPLIQAWIDQGGQPDAIDLLSVATGTDSIRPNYPPDAWLEREGWTVPVMVDPTNSVASAFGLSAYPYWVFLDGNGHVLRRTTGELAIDDLASILTEMPSR